jgi:TolB-like protein
MSQRFALAATAAAIAAVLGLSACSSSAPVRMETTYDEAANNAFIASNKAAIDKLLASVNRESLGQAPVLVATVVNVNDLSRAAPLGRTLSEQYASHLVASGVHVKELKLRGEVFVKEGAGELLLSREIKDIAKSHNAAAVLVGTYSSAASVTYVSLKLVRTEDGRILVGQDYALPNDRDVQRLLAVPR